MAQTSLDSTELPVLQPRTQCVLMARDPEFIYAYWDYTQEDLDRARDRLKFESEASQLVLRVYDVTLIDFNGSNANYTWDLDVGISAKKWYVQVWQDNASYCAELGIRSGKDHFVPLTRSAIVHTPPRSISPRNDLIWQDIKAHKPSQPYIREAINKRYHSVMQKRLKQKPVDDKRPQKPRTYNLTADDIRTYYMNLFALVSNKGRRRALASKSLALKSAGKALLMEDILRIKGISWEKVNPFTTAPARSGGASESRWASGGGSENLFSAGGAASEGRLNNRKFFFEIWAEVIVHGRTESDASVFLNGGQVRLNADGTFSLRYALPDGEIPFKFMAQSSDGIEQRHIITGVEREKTVSFSKMLKGPHG
jgi:hypothetical protein